MRLAVLVSGTGSILQSIIDEGLPVALVVADRPCRGLEIAGDAGIEARLVDRSPYGGYSKSFDREGYTKRIVEVLNERRIDVVAMAGFGTVLTSEMHDAFPQQILNTHPSLLPSFPGWHAVADALAAGVGVTGCTVHLATVETDAGPVLAQEAVEVREDDTEETLHERIKQVERRLYPQTIKRFILEHSGSEARAREALR